MNRELQKQFFAQLFFQMEANKYSKSYIDRFRREINRALNEAEKLNYEGIEVIKQHFTMLLESPTTPVYKRSIIAAIKQYCIDKSVPNGQQKVQRSNRYSKLSSEFKAVIDHYKSFSEAHGLRKSSVYTVANSATSFFFQLQALNITRLSEITEESVLSLFLSSDGERRNSYSLSGNVKLMFSAYNNIDSDASHKVLSFLPKVKRSRKNIQYLTDAEVSKIREALEDFSNTLTYRDRAIVILALYTGLRRCDIVSLNLASIDWVRDKIKITQQKTGIPLELPLNAVVGNAIYDYIKNERPNTGNPTLFVTKDVPYRRLQAGSIWEISRAVMEAAGIRQLPEDRKGLHIFRHRVATTLVENDVSIAVASHLLGHSSPSSTQPYLSADFVHLKGCALSIEHFPMQEGVFCYG